VDGCLAKPYETEHLVARVRALLDRDLGHDRPSPAAHHALLVIDDSPTYRGEIGEALAAAGYEVHDAETGEARWTFATRARVDSSPVVAAGRVYVGSSDGRLYVLDAATGEQQWEFNAGDGITASPAVAAGRVIIGAHNGVIYCFGS